MSHYPVDRSKNELLLPTKRALELRAGGMPAAAAPTVTVAYRAPLIDRSLDQPILPSKQGLELGVRAGAPLYARAAGNATGATMPSTRTLIIGGVAVAAVLWFMSR